MSELHDSPLPAAIPIVGGRAHGQRHLVSERVPAAIRFAPGDERYVLTTVPLASRAVTVYAIDGAGALYARELLESLLARSRFGEARALRDLLAGPLPKMWCARCLGFTPQRAERRDEATALVCVPCGDAKATIAAADLREVAL